jgi:transcriptional activator of cad operon
MDDTVEIGGWQARRAEGRIYRGTEVRAVEPKVMDLLFLLASRPNRVFPREELIEALWPDTTIGEDSLARCVFKLRRALDDDSKAPKLIETAPKRGYRLLQPVAGIESVAAPSPRKGVARLLSVVAAVGLAIIVAAWFARSQPVTGPVDTNAVDVAIARADDSYFQYDWQQNEAAIVLYERALTAEPGAAPALAGLANALVQRELRWPQGPQSSPVAGSVLAAALKSGRLQKPAASARLQRALALAERSVVIDADDTRGQRALGLALSANGRLDEAAAVYDRALRQAPDEWPVLLNRADLLDLAGQSDAALPLLERAYASMNRSYAIMPAQVRPWQSRLGIEIGRRHEAAGHHAEAVLWYGRTLADDPAASDAKERLSALARNAS